MPVPARYTEAVVQAWWGFALSEEKAGPNVFTQIGEILFGGNMIAGTINALAWFGAYAVVLTTFYRALKD